MTRDNITILQHIQPTGSSTYTVHYNEIGRASDETPAICEMPTLKQAVSFVRFLNGGSMNAKERESVRDSLTKHEQTATAAEIKTAFDIGTMTEETRAQIKEQVEKQLTREATAELINAIASQLPKDCDKLERLLLTVRQAYIIGFITAAERAQEANSLTYDQLFRTDEQEENA